MLGLSHPPRRRRTGLTPMIDVVFLLLVFFMVAARFGTTEAVPLRTGAATPVFDGTPRLLVVTPDGLRWNGQTVADLATDVAPRIPSTDAVIALRPTGGADVQRVTDVILALKSLGFTAIALVGDGS